MIVEDEVGVKPVVEVIQETSPVYTLDPGKVYIVPEKAYEVFTDQITHGVEGLCITSRPRGDQVGCGTSPRPPSSGSAMSGGGERYIAPNNLSPPLHNDKVLRREEQE